jgi:peptidoglycan/xylan/chitin deacetylase (PgdA/CDA1 family)
MTKHRTVLLLSFALIIIAFFLKCWYLMFAIGITALLSTFFGVYYLRWNYFMPSVNRLSKTSGQVLLTFDDGPQDVYTEKVLDILKEKDVKAVFFLIGKQVSNRQAIVKRIISEGHQIGNHSFSHVKSFPMWSAKSVVTDIDKADAALAELGIQTNLYRTPFGLSNPNIANAIAEKKLISVGWSLRSFDTLATSKSQLVNRILGKVNSGDIILLHEWGKYTVAALPEIIDGIRAKGLDFAFGIES